MRRFTILHTIETGGPGGAETVLLNLASRLDPGRFRSLALLTENGWLQESLQKHGIQTILLEHRHRFDLGYLRSMARHVRRENVDLIHSHLPDQNFYACLAGWFTGQPTIVTYHGPVELSQAGKFRQAVKLRWVRRSARAVVVVCDYVARMLMALGFPSEKIVRIYNGIDFKGPGAPPGTLRSELGLSSEIPLVGMVANIRRPKGYEFYIRAAREVVDCFPAVQFVAVGDIDESIGGPLAELVRQLKLEDHFHFLGFRSDVPAILPDLDVFVLSSLSEGMPLVILEAMAAGRPVVATRCGGVEELIIDENTGALVPTGDSKALSARICEFLSHRERAAAMGANARAKAVADFSVEKMIHHYESLYERLLEHP